MAFDKPRPNGKWLEAFCGLDKVPEEMSYQVLQQRRFLRQCKKLHPNVKRDLDAAVSAIATDPTLGDRKKGDLAGLLVYKFHSQGQLYLLGYTRDDGIRLIYLQAVGPHENFYRDLKR